MQNLLLVGAGGALGAISRFAVAEAFERRLGGSWPYGTLFINVTGCFVIALFLTLASERLTLAPQWRYFFPIGFVGAYTTFSTYQSELQRLLAAGSALGALLYFLLSNLFGFGAILAGRWLARRF